MKLRVHLNHVTTEERATWTLQFERKCLTTERTTHSEDNATHACHEGHEKLQYQFSRCGSRVTVVDAVRMEHTLLQPPITGRSEDEEC